MIGPWIRVETIGDVCTARVGPVAYVGTRDEVAGFVGELLARMRSRELPSPAR